MTHKIISTFLFLLSVNATLSFCIEPGPPLANPPETNRLIVRFRPGVLPPSAPGNLAPMSSGPMIRSRMRYSGITDPALQALIEENEATVRPLWRGPSIQGDVPDLSGLCVITLERMKPDRTLKSIAAEYETHPDVLYAEPDRVVHVATTTPDDPYYATSGTWEQPYADLWGLYAIDAGAAWDISLGSEEVVVAVVDTGLDFNHADIQGNIWVNPGEIPDNGLDDDGNGFIDDVHGWNFVGKDPFPNDGHGHGTHVAGTIAAVGNNATGIVGVTWRCKIMPLQGLGAGGSGNISDLVACILYAADNGADVINNSWGNNQADRTPQSLIDAVAYAAAKGSVVVAAAGNSTKNVGTPASGFYPACIEPVVAVSAANASSELASFSNFGPRINVAAPGVDVLSLLAKDSLFDTDSQYADRKVGTEYIRLNGTSMASPHTAGVAALVRSLAPGLNPRKVRGLLELGATDLGDPGKDDEFGWGLLNAAGTLALLPEPGVMIASPDFDTRIPSGISLNIFGSATGEGMTNYRIESIRQSDFGTGGSWTLIAEGASPVENSLLGAWNPVPVQEDEYIVRLSASFPGEGTATVWKRDHVRIRIDNSTINAPIAGRTVRGSVPIVGTAAGTGFQSYRLYYRRGTDSFTQFRSSTTPVVDDPNDPSDGNLGTWNSVGRRDGTYDIKLEVTRSGETESEIVQVLLDNLRNEIVKPEYYSTADGISPVLGSASSPNTGFTRTLDHYAGMEDYSHTQFVGGYQPYNKTVLYSGSAQINDATLHQWNTSLVPNGWGLLVQTVKDSVNYSEYLPVLVRNETIPSMPGWPGWGGGMEITGSLTFGNLDDDPELEIVGAVETYRYYDFFIGGYSLHTIFVWNHDRTPMPGWEGQHQMGPSGQNPSPTLGDITGDGALEIVASDKNRIYAWKADGSPVPGWENGLHIGNVPQNSYVWGSACPVLVDLNGNGRKEIIQAGSRIYIFRGDGSNYPGWPKNTEYTTRFGEEYTYSVPPAVGDIDGDGNLDIVAVLPYNPTMVYAWKSDGRPMPGAWPVSLGDIYTGFSCAPALGDTNGDGRAEIYINCGNRLLRLDHLGNVTLLDSWSSYYGEVPFSGVTLANLDDDPMPEIIVPTVGDNMYYAMARVGVYDNDETLLWEKLWNATFAWEPSVVVADVNGNGAVEIVCPIGDRIYAWDVHGNLLPHFPFGAANTIMGAPFFADINGDGTVEMGYGTTDYWIYLWNLPWAYNPNRWEWPEFRGGRGHTGAYTPRKPAMMIHGR